MNPTKSWGIEDLSQITGGVLAGGAGRRLGGLDKGQYVWRGQSFIERSVSRLEPQVGEIRISANRNLAWYRQFGYPVITDATADYAGPLAGLHQLLQATHTPLLLVIPVDTPCFPRDLAANLFAALDESTDIVAARSPGGAHPLHALLRTHRAADLARALAAGTRRVTDWYAQCALRWVDWLLDTPFHNINTPHDATALTDEPVL